MASSNHIAHDHEESTRRVPLASQGTNSNKLAHFDAISTKLEEFMKNPDTPITPQLKSYIKSLGCPHLEQVLLKKID